ncbi:MAG TPA: glycosyltransferase [Ramlibacter sp.]|jgi:glycosyltransferase involved in cell wall biosynthesis|uniref:glycosyltransferase n=1 Tax=Ramlibacter sp. TaxID=1917967 RepID=UPI002D684E08|nr:glycosyltransferase [Ramlibacter sp.]HZY18483.1 glycosyltransferase [Ramlibacter sp.]
MRTAFVVLTYNRSDALLAVLRALAPQCGGDDVVVVADDGSRPEHIQALRDGLPRFACPVRHVWHPDVGFTAARSRNLGALHAGGDYVVFLDGDCVPNARFVQRHRQLAQAGCFVNGSRVLLDEALTRRVAAGELDLLALGPAGWLRLRATGHINKLAHLLQWPGAPGRLQRAFRWKGIRSANFGTWMRDFEAVNGFDESFHGWGHEDADLVLRLHHAGLMRKNGYLATEVFHLWHPENSRARESDNRRRVEERMAGRVTRAAVGLAEIARGPAAQITELNR